jgi:hypothetical protein
VAIKNKNQIVLSILQKFFDTHTIFAKVFIAIWQPTETQNQMLLSIFRGTDSHTIYSDGASYSASFDKIKTENFDYSMEIK